MLDPKSQKKGFRAFADQAKERETTHEAESVAAINASPSATTEPVTPPPAKTTDTPRK